MSALPDMYAQAQGHTVPEGKCEHIRQSKGACVATNATFPVMLLYLYCDVYTLIIFVAKLVKFYYSIIKPGILDNG